MEINFTWEEALRLINESTSEVGTHDMGVQPMVSVCLMTYNQSSYIDEAIQSVLSQKTDFPVEIVVGDDGSTDGTYEILLKYQAKHASQVRILRSTPNLGSYTGNGRLNFIRNLKACRGKYVALLEGDDYWTEETKLQQQVDFLEENKDYSGYCCNVMQRWDEADGVRMALYNQSQQKDPLPLGAMVTRYVAQTGSYCMRGVPEWVFTDWFVNLDAADNAILWGMAMQGKVKYNHEPWSVWRRQKGTATSIIGANFFKHYSHRFEILMHFEELYGVCLEKEKKIIFEGAVSSEIIRNPKMAVRRLLGAQYRNIKSIFDKITLRVK